MVAVLIIAVMAFTLGACFMLEALACVCKYNNSIKRKRHGGKLMYKAGMCFAVACASIALYQNGILAFAFLLISIACFFASYEVYQLLVKERIENFGKEISEMVQEEHRT